MNCFQAAVLPSSYHLLLLLLLLRSLIPAVTWHNMRRSHNALSAFFDWEPLSAAAGFFKVWNMDPGRDKNVSQRMPNERASTDPGDVHSPTSKLPEPWCNSCARRWIQHPTRRPKPVLPLTHLSEQKCSRKLQMNCVTWSLIALCEWRLKGQATRRSHQSSF